MTLQYVEDKLYKHQYILFIGDIFSHACFMNERGIEVIRKIKLCGAVLITLMLISLILFASGCSQKAPENETRERNKKIENESKNITKEAEEVPQELVNVVEKSDRNIMETLADKNFTILVDLINAAGLEKTLAEGGPYTVFAPTDKAFAELPEGTVPALRNNTQELKKVLTYHVSDKLLMEKDIVNLTNIQTLEGENLPVNETVEGIQVGGANYNKSRHPDRQWSNSSNR